MVQLLPLGQAVVEEEEGWLLATLMATAMPLATTMPLATAIPMALVRCFVVVAVSAVVVVERLAFAWRLWLPVAAGRCRVVAGLVSALPPVVSALLVVASVPPHLKQALPHRLPWRLVAAQWQPWRLWRLFLLGVGKAQAVPAGG